MLNKIFNLRTLIGGISTTASVITLSQFYKTLHNKYIAFIEDAHKKVIDSILEQYRLGYINEDAKNKLTANCLRLKETILSRKNYSDYMANLQNELTNPSLSES